jgi:hypothetical protein
LFYKLGNTNFKRKLISKYITLLRKHILILNRNKLNFEVRKGNINNICQIKTKKSDHYIFRDKLNEMD